MSVTEITSTVAVSGPSQPSQGPTRDNLEALASKIAAHREQIYAAGEVLDEVGRGVPIWPAGVIKPAADALRDLVTREKATRTVEVGLGVGLSSMAIVEGLARQGNPAAAHLTIDPGQAWCDRAGIRALRESGADQLAQVCEQDSALALPALAAAGEVFDLAFIDGAHLFDQVIVDLFFAMRIVKPGGLIVMDDHWMPSVQTVLAFAVTNWGVTLELFDPEGPAKRLVAFRNAGADKSRAWDHFRPFSRADLPPYPWRA